MNRFTTMKNTVRGGFAHGGWVFPVLIGTGKRLFGSGTVPAAMTLVRSATTRAGVVFSVYRRAGALKTGSFELPEK